MSEEKQKAETIVEMFSAKIKHLNHLDSTTTLLAIECAKLHVNEILNSDRDNDYPKYDYNNHKLGVDYDYWNGVLTELNKM